MPGPGPEKACTCYPEEGNIYNTYCVTLRKMAVWSIESKFLNCTDWKPKNSILLTLHTLASCIW